MNTETTKEERDFLHRMDAMEEAEKIYKETGKTPRELQAENERLREALKGLIQALGAPDKEPVESAIRQAGEALN